MECLASPSRAHSEVSSISLVDLDLDPQAHVSVR